MSENPERELEEYREQLVLVEEALREDPTNEEMLALQKELNDVIALTNDVIAAKQQEEQQQQRAAAQVPGDGAIFSPAISTTATMTTDRLRVGGECEALHPKERRWYNAVIRSATQDGYLVEFGAREQPVFLEKGSVRPVGAGSAAAAAEMEKRRKEAAEEVPTEIPKWLRIKPTDSEKEKQRKKKRIKTIKNQMRVKKIDEDFDKKRLSWQSFCKKKGNSHESMFKTTGGKVGVVGGGRAMTPYATNKTKIDNTDAIRKESELSNNYKDF